MECRMQTDFSRVNVHTGYESVQMIRELGARAFTVGNNVYFNNGEYRPETTEGKKLLAHVIQQNTVANIIRRDDIKPVAAAPPKLKYKYAEKENKRYAQPDSLG